MTVRVLLLENVNTTAHQIFNEGGFQIEAVAGSLKESELVECVKGVHLLGIRSKTRITEKVLAAADSLLSLGCFCIGTNQVDLAYANGRGIPVFNAPFSNTRSVAELVLAEVVALARQLGDRSREVHEGKWRKISVGCFEVRGKTLGIVGYGHIGTQIGVLAESFGMRVIFHDIQTKLPLGNNRATSGLAELLSEADFVTLHVPETRETKGLIGKAEIETMAKGSYLINASRGQVVDLDALAAAIKTGHIAGAAVDVYPEEPEANGEGFTNPLLGLPNVILTPHIGGSTEEAQASIGREVATSLTKFVKAGATSGAVNFPQIEMSQERGTHRVLNVHHNVPGVLRDINRIVSDRQANILRQTLSTDANIGYLMMDLDKEVAVEVARDIGLLETNIRTRSV